MLWPAVLFSLDGAHAGSMHLQEDKALWRLAVYRWQTGYYVPVDHYHNWQHRVKSDTFAEKQTRGDNRIELKIPVGL